MSSTNLVARQPRGLQGRHALAIFLAFFGAVFVVNGAMIYSAISTHTGLVANEPYRKGLAYNERIAADERQTRLQWREAIDVHSDGHIAFVLTDAQGRPVSHLKVNGVLGRPSTIRHDVDLAFTETEPGRYEARIDTIADGSWLISLDAKSNTDAQIVYRTRRRLWLKQ